ncbi:sulfur carrier protein ThiS [Dryocola sp. LX212]|jgi:sulfur carrier protein
MRIFLNDESVPCVNNLTLTALLEQLRMLKPGTAAAVNQTIVPREQWEQHLLQDGDQILLFQAIAGG